MSQGDEFEFQRSAATNPEREQGTEGGQKREHAEDGMTAASKTLCFLGLLSFEQAQAEDLGQLWTLSGDRQLVRFAIPPLPLEGLPEPLRMPDATGKAA